MNTPPESDETDDGDVLRSGSTGSLVARGSLVRGAGYAVGVAMAFLTSVLLLRHLGTADYGRYGTIAALMGLVLAITDGGMTTVGARELAVLPRGREREALASSLMTLRAVAAVAGVAIATAFAGLAYGTALMLGAALVGISVVLQSSQAMATVPLLADLRAVPIAGFDALRQALTLLGVFALVLAGATLLPFFALQIPVTAIVLAVTFLYVRRSFALGFSAHRPHLSRLLRETLPMSVVVVLNSLYLSAMVLVVSLLEDDAQTGIYAAPARTMETLMFLASVMIFVAAPVLAVSGAEDRERFRQGLQVLLQASVAIGATLAVGLILCSTALMELIGGAAFAPSGPVLQVQAVALVGVFANQALLFALVSLKASRRLIVANAVALATLLAAGVVLVEISGPRGAALAVVIGEIALSGALLLAIRRTDRSVMPSLRFALLGVVAFAIALSPALLPVSAWLEAILGALLFLALAVAARVVPPEAISATRAALARSAGP